MDALWGSCDLIRIYIHMMGTYSQRGKYFLLALYILHFINKSLSLLKKDYLPLLTYFSSCSNLVTSLKPKAIDQKLI